MLVRIFHGISGTKYCLPNKHLKHMLQRILIKFLHTLQWHVNWKDLQLNCKLTGSKDSTKCHHVLPIVCKCFLLLHYRICSSCLWFLPRPDHVSSISTSHVFMSPWRYRLTVLSICYHIPHLTEKQLQLWSYLLVVFTWPLQKHRQQCKIMYMLMKVL